MSMTNKVIYTDCDGVLVNWTADFFRWCYVEHNLPMVAPHNDYDIGNVLGVDKYKALDLVFEFNNSTAITTLKPYNDAIKYVRKLYEEHGYSFVVISAMGIDKSGYVNRERRKENLRNLFGRAISKVVIVNDNKTKQLKAYSKVEKAVRNMGPIRPVYWIEDNPMQAKAGFDHGFETLLMHASYNRNINTAHYDERVYNWKDIYERITNETG